MVKAHESHVVCRLRIFPARGKDRNRRRKRNIRATIKWVSVEKFVSQTDPFARGDYFICFSLGDLFNRDNYEFRQKLQVSVFVELIPLKDKHIYEKK